MNLTNITLMVNENSFNYDPMLDQTVVFASDCISYTHELFVWNKVYMIMIGVLIFLWFVTAHKAGWFKKKEK